MKYWFNFITVLLLSNFYLQSAGSESIHLKLEEFAASKTWRNFLLPKVKDPLRELKISIEKLQNDKSGKYSCLYPARIFHLEKHGLISGRSKPCEPFLEWKNRLKGDAISLVFAAQFISNPASAMGHTFLRIHDKQFEDFLHISIGYAAEVDESDGPLLYAIKGLGGMYQGIFFEGPFYEKVHEYSNMERRDIWSYELNLNAEQRDLLLAYIWELKTTAKIDYYFLNGNCSSFLLALIQAVVPEEELKTQFFLYTAPYQTVKTLQKAGLVKKESFRPSLRSQLVKAFSELSQKEKESFQDSYERKSTKSALSAANLDALILKMLLRKQKNEGALSEQERTYYHDLLLLRSRSKTPQNSMSNESTNSPLKAHLPRQIDYKFGKSLNKQTYEAITLRPGAHQYMDKQTGFLPNSTFSFLETEISHTLDDGKTFLNRLTFFDLKNIIPWSPADPQPSFKVLLESKRQDIFCSGCQRIAAEFFLGGSMGTEVLSLNGFLGVQEEISNHFERGHSTWAAFELEALVNWGHQRLRLSNIFARGAHVDRLTHFLQFRRFDLRPHLHLGTDLKFQSLVEGKSQFEQSLVVSYDF